MPPHRTALARPTATLPSRANTRACTQACTLYAAPKPTSKAAAAAAGTPDVLKGAATSWRQRGAVYPACRSRTHIWSRGWGRDSGGE